MAKFAEQRSGIYKITGPHGKFYIGQAINICQRWKAHRSKLRAGCHENAKLQNAWNRHGESEFSFEVIVYCHAEELDAKEQTALDESNAVKDGYNIVALASGGSRNGRKLPSVAEANRKRSGALHPSFGRPRPDLSERNRIQPSPMLGRKNPSAIDRARLMGLANRGRPHRFRGKLLGPKKLRWQVESIVDRLKVGESIASIARECRVKWHTIKYLQTWHGHITAGMIV